MGEAFLHNLDEIVTRDHLDARLTEMEARINQRFSEVDKRFGEANERFAGIEGKLRLLFWMQGLTIAIIVLPALNKFFG